MFQAMTNAAVYLVDSFIQKSLRHETQSNPSTEPSIREPNFDVLTVDLNSWPSRVCFIWGEEKKKKKKGKKTPNRIKME